MNGAWGSMLTQFPEAKVELEYFDMQPLDGSGYGPRTDVKKITVVFQRTLGRKVESSNGNLVLRRGIRFWYPGTLVVGRFVDDGEFVYRVGMPDNSWTNEAGFTVYDCFRVVGADGTETVEPAFKQGGGVIA